MFLYVEIGFGESERWVTPKNSLFLLGLFRINALHTEKVLKLAFFCTLKITALKCAVLIYRLDHTHFKERIHSKNLKENILLLVLYSK